MNIEYTLISKLPRECGRTAYMRLVQFGTLDTVRDMSITLVHCVR